MESQLFRKNSMERITSPERLQDYIRVTNPGIWMVLAAVIALLAGFIVVSALGTIETKLDVTGEMSDGTLRIEMLRNEAKDIKEGMPVRVADRETKIGYIYSGDTNHVTFTAAIDLPDGIYEAQIVTEIISPIS
ncbi:MAG: hypothetical protein ACSW8J_05480, partial [bacterium]